MRLRKPSLALAGIALLAAASANTTSAQRERDDRGSRDNSSRVFYSFLYRAPQPNQGLRGAAPRPSNPDMRGSSDKGGDRGMRGMGSGHMNGGMRGRRQKNQRTNRVTSKQAVLCGSEELGQGALRARAPSF